VEYTGRENVGFGAAVGERKSGDGSNKFRVADVLVGKVGR